MKLRALLSVNEEEMFTVLGFSDLLDLTEREFSISSLYQTAVNRAFTHTLKTSPDYQPASVIGRVEDAIESLRRTFRAFQITADPPRQTREFDELIIIRQPAKTK